MKKLICTVAAAGLAAAAIVPFAGATSVSPCSTGALIVNFKLIPNSQGAGNVEYKLNVTSTGPRLCSLGRPTVTLLGKTGAALPSHSHATGAPILLPAYGKASANARFSPDVAGTGDRQTGRCQPTAYKVRVSFRGAIGSTTGPVKPPTPVCERGSLSLNALSAHLQLQRR
ncbi:MAG: DUF4232 domain-containing protein [Solirubrobacteraceae bacterium]